MIIFGAMLSIAVLMLFIMLFAFCFKKGKKKLPPADVIPEVSRLLIVSYYLGIEMGMRKVLCIQFLFLQNCVCLCENVLEKIVFRL